MTRVPNPDPVLTAPPVPRWARLLAHAVGLAVLPSCLWRLGLAAGHRLGYTEDGILGICPPGAWGPAYLVGLTLLTELAALLTLGLVSRWGEELPRWVPFLGGRRPEPRLVAAAAWAGVATLTVLWTPFSAWWAIPHPDMTGTGALLVGFLYLPLVAWAPMLAAVTVSYQRRHRG